MKYSELLSKLIFLSGLKMKDIASELMYDNSYVSKWINNKNLPSSKSYFEINQKLSQLFAHAIYDMGKADEVLKLSEKKLPASLVTLRYTIHGLLQEAYFSSTQDFNVPEQEIKEKEVFIGTREISENLQRIVSYVFSNLSEPLHIISSSDYSFTLTFGNQMKYITYTTKNIPIKYTVIVNITNETEVYDTFKEFLKLTFQYGQYEFNVFLITERLASHMTILGESVIFFYELSSSGEPILMVSSNNHWLLQNRRKNILPLYKNQKPAIFTSSDYDTELYVLRKIFKPDQEFILYLSNFSCYFLPDDVVEKLFRKHKISDVQKEKFNQIQILYSIIFSSMKVKVIFPETELFKTISASTTEFCGRQIKLTKKEIAQFIDFVKNAGENEFTHVEYYYDKTLDESLKFGSLNVSFLASSNITLFVRHSNVAEDVTMKYIVYDHELTTQTFIQYLDNNFKSGMYERISFEELNSWFNRAKLFNSTINDK